MTYDLDLDHVDDDGGIVFLVEEWVQREELRRAWWLVWELDAFGSTISNRAYAINYKIMLVLLPVSDKSCFEESPVASI
jgi:hypothetical protein